MKSVPFDSGGEAPLALRMANGMGLRGFAAREFCAQDGSKKSKFLVFVAQVVDGKVKEGEEADYCGRDAGEALRIGFGTVTLLLDFLYFAFVAIAHDPAHMGLEFIELVGNA